MSSPLAVVTGASSGIGNAMARQLVDQGCRVLAVARRGERLQALADELAGRGRGQLMPIVADLTERADVERVRLRVVELGGLRWVANVAGTISLGAFVDQDPARLQAQIRINCEGLVLLTRALLPCLLASGGGRVLNVASVAGTMPTPLMAVYGASKAFVISFSEALREELRPHGITVTAYCPGPVDTPIYEIAAPGRSRRAPSNEVSAARAARDGLAAARSGRAVVVPGWKNKLNVWGARLSPRSVLLRVLAAQRLGFLGYPPDAFTRTSLAKPPEE